MCNYTSVNLRNLKDHGNKKHLEIAVIKCDECGFYAKNIRFLKRHQLKIHNIFLKVSRNRKDKEIICNFCKFFASSREMAVHMKIEHPNEKLFACEKCDYRSNFMHNITMHKNGKHQQKKLVCNQCNFETFWTNELLHHKRTVHDIFKNYCKSRETLRLSDVVRLCDHYGFQTNKYSTMIQQKQKKCGSSKLSKPFVKIDVEITVESDAAKVLSEVEKYRADMSY